LSNQLHLEYLRCRRFVASKNENFPVASFFLGKNLSNSISAIYKFAREADDIADEGNFSADDRQTKLEYIAKQITLIANKQNVAEEYLALQDTINQYNLPTEYFSSLLRAFYTDTVKCDYANLSELLDYCKLSANPVGRLLLLLTNNDSKYNQVLADKICTALQLLNFWQDYSSDLQLRNRCYLPKDKMLQYMVTKEQILAKRFSVGLKDCLQEQIIYAREVLLAGASLGKIIPGKFGFELRIVVNAAILLCHKLLTRDNIFTRPKLTRVERLQACIKALR